MEFQADNNVKVQHLLFAFSKSHKTGKAARNIFAVYEDEMFQNHETNNAKL